MCPASLAQVRVLGPGAVGVYLAGRLASTHPRVGLISLRSVAPAGLWTLVSQDGAEEKVNFGSEAWSTASPLGSGDWVIVTLKAPAFLRWIDEPATARWLGQGNVILAPNGLGLWARAQRRAPQACWVRGAVWFGVRSDGSARVTLVGEGGLYLAAGDPAQAESASKLFEGSGVVAKSVGGGPLLLEWRKALLNLTLNGLAAANGVPNGGILERAELKREAEALLAEALSVARASGVALGDDDVDRVWRVIQSTAANRNSLLQDMDAQRETELASLNLELIRQARDLALPVPHHERLVARLQALGVLC